MPKYSIEKEYETLRSEILQSKKYVFERPILIITVSIALFKFIEEDYATYLPMVIIGLLFFNLWFTVNRILSISRIIAYIQLILENNSETNWFGWETSLRNYRKWTKRNPLIKNNVFDNEAIYDNLGYYPTIYIMHIIVSCIAFIALLISSIEKLDTNISIISFTFISLILFLVYSIRNRPNKLKPYIEKNRYIWQKVSENWEMLEKS